MTISEKIKTIDSKVERSKVQYDYTDKLLRSQLYRKETFLNMNYWLAKMFYQKKILLEKAARMERFEYSL